MLTKIRLLGKRLAHVSGLNLLINKLWNTYEHLIFSYYIRQNLKNINRDTVINPFGIYWVSPEEIKASSGKSFDFLVDTGRIVSGSWDLNHGPEITSSALYNWFQNHFENDCPWESTDKYITGVQKIKSGRSSRYTTVSEYEAKLQSYDTMYREFECENYLLQSELVNKQKFSLPGDGGRALFPSLTDHTLMRHEIAVNIGRNGTLLRNDGRHRLCLALLAGVEEIPVRVVVRHTEWQNLRDTVARTIDDALEAGVPVETVRNHVQDTLAEELDNVKNGLDHPDLDIIFERRLPTD